MLRRSNSKFFNNFSPREHRKPEISIIFRAILLLPNLVDSNLRFLHVPKFLKTNAHSFIPQHKKMARIPSPNFNSLPHSFRPRNPALDNRRHKTPPAGRRNNAGRASDPIQLHAHNIRNFSSPNLSFHFQIQHNLEHSIHNTPNPPLLLSAMVLHRIQRNHNTKIQQYKMASASSAVSEKSVEMGYSDSSMSGEYRF